MLLYRIIQSIANMHLFYFDTHYICILQPHRICVSVPFYHCFGNVAGTLASNLMGATCVVPCPSFNGKACVEAIEKEKCTSIYGTPTMFVDMLDYARQLKPDVR
jgi:fatty-acyl-CoA synthase